MKSVTTSRPPFTMLFNRLHGCQAERFLVRFHRRSLSESSQLTECVARATDLPRHEGRSIVLFDVNNKPQEVVLTRRNILCLQVLCFAALWYEQKSLHLTSDYTFEDIESLGMIGPGRSRLTIILEACFAAVPIMKLHAVYHDAWGLYHRKTGRSNGYCYGIKDDNLCTSFKKSFLLGHLSGLLYLLWNRRFFCEQLSYLSGSGKSCENEREQETETLRQDHRQGTNI